MKQILLFLFIAITTKCYSQNLDTVSVNLTLKSGDWAYIAGSIQPTDSFMMVYYRRIRDTIRLANPSNYTTNVRVNALPGSLVYNIYRLVKNQPETVYTQIGTNISTQIKAITNTTLQNFITAYDNAAIDEYIYRRTLGKHIVMDN